MPKNPKPLEIEPDAFCAFCGTPLPEPEERDPRQKYCSRWCGREANRADVPPVPKRRGECEVCGAEFWTHRPHARFCSSRCWWKDYRRRVPRPSRAGPPPDPRPCLECGQVFQPRRKDKVYCSTRCGNRLRNRRYEARRRG